MDQAQQGTESIGKDQMASSPIVQTQQPLPIPTPDAGVSPLMTSSLSSLASGSDVYARQFYGGAAYRQRRFLPVNLK